MSDLCRFAKCLVEDVSDILSPNTSQESNIAVCNIAYLEVPIAPPSGRAQILPCSSKLPNSLISVGVISYRGSNTTWTSSPALPS